MRRSQKRLLILISSVPLLLLVSALGYMWGMSALEGKPRHFWDSLEFAAETLSTTGFGLDSHWSHPLMVLYVVFLQFIGVFLMFLIIPIYLVPYLEDRFEARLPRKAPPKLADHVVIYRYGPAVETLVEQLTSAGVASLVVETNEEEARSLLERGRAVVFAREESDAVEICNLLQARALVANGHDEENAGLILRARQAGFSGDIAALVEEPLRRRPMELAGASAVYTPRHILAAALAARASSLISPRLAGAQQLGNSLEVRELRIEPGSQLSGKSLQSSAIGKRTGATVIGQWVGGRLLTDPGPEMVLEPGGILVVLGTPETLRELPDLLEGTSPLRREGPFIVAGFGEVGRKVHQLLTDAGERVVTIDRTAQPDVDLVGNAFDPDLLRQAGLEGAQAVILAVDSDDATLFATVVIRDAASHVPVIARVNEARNVENIHRAGADFALSISQVSGQILSQRLLGQEAISVDAQLKVQKFDASGLAGQHPRDLLSQEAHRVRIVAIERSGTLILSFPEDLVIEQGDSLFVCGSAEGVRNYIASSSRAT